MRKITTTTYEFDKSDKVIYAGPTDLKPPGNYGLVVGEDSHDYHVTWNTGEGWTDVDHVDKSDLRPYTPKRYPFCFICWDRNCPGWSLSWVLTAAVAALITLITVLWVVV
jgi:hypothetical protein